MPKRQLHEVSWTQWAELAVDARRNLQAGAGAGPGQADLCPRTVGWNQEGQPQAPKAGDVFHETWPGSHHNISLHLQEVALSLLAPPRPRLQLSQKGLLSPPAQQTGNDRAALWPGRAPLAATIPSMRIKSDIVAGNMAGFSPKVADLGGKGGPNNSLLPGFSTLGNGL